MFHNRRQLASVRRPFVGGGPGPTTWDPALATNVSLSPDKLTATSTTLSGGSYIQSTLAASYKIGKKYCELTWNQLSGGGASTWVFWLIRTNGGTYPLTYIFLQNGLVLIEGTSAGPGTSVASGVTLAAAVDFDLSRIWIRSTSNTNWNANASADPNTNVGGYSFSSVANGTDVFNLGVNFQDVAGDNVMANFGASAYIVGAGKPSLFTNW